MLLKTGGHYNRQALIRSPVEQCLRFLNTEPIAICSWPKSLLCWVRDWRRWLLLAFDLAREQAGQVLGTAMAIKMVAYILVTPPPCFSACREFASPCSAGFSRPDPSLNSPGFAVRCGSLGSIYVNRCASVRIGCFYANVPVHHPGNTPG